MNNEGWICPKCGRVYAPWMMMCSYCSNYDLSRVGDLNPYSGTGTDTGETVPNTPPLTDHPPQPYGTYGTGSWKDSDYGKYQSWNMT